MDNFNALNNYRAQEKCFAFNVLQDHLSDDRFAVKAFREVLDEVEAADDTKQEGG